MPVRRTSPRPAIPSPRKARPPAVVLAAALSACAGGTGPIDAPATSAPGRAASGEGSDGEGREETRRFLGTVTGGELDSHGFEVSAGQAVWVEVSFATTALYFNVLPPGGDVGEALYVGAQEAEPVWEHRVRESGRYVLQVYQRGSAKDSGRSSDYAATVTLTDPRCRSDGQASAPGAPAIGFANGTARSGIGVGRLPR